MLKGKAAEGLSRASLAHIHQVLSRALRWAERNGRVARNIATLVDTPQGSRRVSKALTVEQARALLATARGDRFEALWTLGLTIPSRPGELIGLCWD
ncbi:MAG: site-specific integrase, partial [Actinobacteria bacterium]|nr:site-specific integrase [Actinomycetota bacterium]